MPHAALHSCYTPNRCGTPGTGKSMRAKRMMQLLCEGWMMGSGSSSAKAGMNGGFDYLCGRLVYYDGVWRIV